MQDTALTWTTDLAKQLNNPLNNSIENERSLGGDQQLFAVRWDKVCPGKPRSLLF